MTDETKKKIIALLNAEDLEWGEITFVIKDSQVVMVKEEKCTKI
jgi:hypothetical protein